MKGAHLLVPKHWFWGAVKWWFNPKSCLTLVTPQTVARQAPPSMGFSRQEYWSELLFPSPGDLPNPWIEPQSSALQAVYRLSFRESSPEGQASNLMCTSRSLPEPSLGIKTAGAAFTISLCLAPASWYHLYIYIYFFFFFNSRAFIFIFFLWIWSLHFPSAFLQPVGHIVLPFFHTPKHYLLKGRIYTHLVPEFCDCRPGDALWLLALETSGDCIAGSHGTVAVVQSFCRLSPPRHCRQ